MKIHPCYSVYQYFIPLPSNIPLYGCPFSVTVTSRACPHCPPSSPVPAWEARLGCRAGSRWPAVLTHFPTSQCGAASPALVQGEPCGRGGGLSALSTPGKQRPPHPHERCAEEAETGSLSAVLVAPGSWPHGPVGSDGHGEGQPPAQASATFRWSREHQRQDAGVS